MIFIKKKTIYSLSGLSAFAAIILAAQLLLTSETVVNLQKAESHVDHSMASMIEPYENLEDLIEFSDNIVHGTVTGMTTFDETTMEYVLTLNKEYKGKIETKDIFVYEVVSTLNKGDQYILFLTGTENDLYPGVIYTSIDKGSILKVVGNRLVHQSSILDPDLNLKDTLKEIEDSPSTKVQKLKNHMPLKVKDFASVEELTGTADIIATIIPTAFGTKNKYVKSASFEIVETHKGTLDATIPVFLPASVELDQEYMVFLQDSEILTVVSKDGSVINKKEIEKIKIAKTLLDEE